MLDVNFKGETTEEIQAEINLATSEFSTFLKGYYLTGKEIIEAYRMALSGELKYKVYPTLSLIQCGEILDLYQEFKVNSHNRDLGLKMLNNLNKRPEPELSESDLSKIDNDFEFKIFKEIQKSGFSEDADFFHISLKEKGKLRNWDLKTQKRFYDYVSKKHYEKLKLKHKVGNITRVFLQGLKKDIDAKNYRDDIKIICKKIMVCNYLKKHCEDFEQFKNALK